MTEYSRAGFKWSVNEILSLQREFELLGLNIDQISTKHNRSPDAIMYKLDQEGFADYNVLYSNYHDLNATIPVARKPSHSPSSLLNLQSCCDETECCPENDDDEECYDDCYDEDYVEEDDQDDDDEVDEEDEVANLSERVEGLEGSIFEIRDMIKSMMGSFFSQKPSYASACV
jgi:hypothetical protein